MQIVPNADETNQNVSIMNEQMQAKFMALILREFRKNREYTKYREQKKFANQFVKEKILS